MESRQTISSPSLDGGFFGSLDAAKTVFADALYSALPPEPPAPIALPAPHIRGPFLLDPALVQPSPYTNRLAHTWESPDFKELMKQIAVTKGNVQPIKVRSLGGSPERWEVVYGHRRAAATQQLGLKVLAIVEDVDDRQLVVQMVHENLARKDACPYERAEHLKRVLSYSVYASVEELADALGRDRSGLYKLLKLAELPHEVVAAFRSPAYLQVAFGPRLEDALEADREGVLERARQIAAEHKPTDPKLVLEALAPQAILKRKAPRVEQIRIEVDGVLWAVISMPPAASGGKTTVVFERPVEKSALQKTLLKLTVRAAATACE